MRAVRPIDGLTARPATTRVQGNLFPCRTRYLPAPTLHKDDTVRIAIVNRHQNDVLGGSEMQCHNIADGLTRRRHEVAYVAPWGGGSYNTSYQVVSVVPSPKAIAAGVLQFRPDIVYWRFDKHMLLRTARKLAQENVPFVFAISHIDNVRVASSWSNPWVSAHDFIRAAKQSLLSASNHLGFRYVTAVTSLNPDYVGKLPVKLQKFVPNSVPMEAVPFSWPKQYVVWVANIKPPKRPEVYLKLAQALAHKNVDFLMVGAIQSQEYDWIAHGGTGVHYLGQKTIEETNGIIANAIALIHTCKPEGFGNNFLQAWLQGVPTVSLGFDPAGYIERFRLGGYAADDWDVFVAQVERLIHNPDMALEAGRRARGFAAARFSLDRTLDTLELFLARVLADTKKGGA
jgi:glycosyltransferase involved in cell wall biosynthesis